MRIQRFFLVLIQFLLNNLSKSKLKLLRSRILRHLKRFELFCNSRQPICFKKKNISTVTCHYRITKFRESNVQFRYIMFICSGKSYSFCEARQIYRLAVLMYVHICHWLTSVNDARQLRKTKDTSFDVRYRYRLLMLLNSISYIVGNSINNVTFRGRTKQPFKQLS